MKKSLCILMCAVAMMVFASAACAEKGKTFSITPYIGGYLYEGNEDIKVNSLVYGLRLGYNLTNNWTLEGEFDYNATKHDVTDKNIDNYGYRLQALYHFGPDNRLVPFLSMGVGGRSLRFKDSSPSGIDQLNENFGAGLKYFITDSLALRGDVRYILLFNEKWNNMEYTFGLTYLFGGKARAARTEAVVRDSDQDGVIDGDDECPGTPSGVQVDKGGCPVDSDRDGVADYLDKCPGTPTGVQVNKDGCPVDSDRDGVADYLDKCPGTPAGEQVDKDGCPPLIEEKQAAQAQPEVIEAPVVPPPVVAPPPPAPVVAPVVKKMPKEKEAIALEVEFDTNKAIVKKKYHNKIKAVADFMKEYSETKATIEGHTDNVGKVSANVRLSQARADSIRQYLIDNFGIDGSRLTAIGYGPKKPIASNATKAGKQKNRRVEAVIESTDK